MIGTGFAFFLLNRGIGNFVEAVRKGIGKLGISVVG